MHNITIDEIREKLLTVIEYSQEGLLRWLYIINFFWKNELKCSFRIDFCKKCGLKFCKDYPFTWESETDCKVRINFNNKSLEEIIDTIIYYIEQYGLNEDCDKIVVNKY